MKKIAIECFDVVPFMKQKQRRKKRKEERKKGIQRKQKRQEERKKEKNTRETEREIEKGGGQKRLRRNTGRHSKINKNVLFLGGKQVFFLLRAKKGKEKTQKQKKGGFRAK